MKKAVMLIVLLMLATLAGGCAEFGAYVKDRGKDFVDIFALHISAGGGIVVNMRATAFCQAGIGFSEDVYKLGFKGRKGGLWKTEGREFGLPLLGYGMTYATETIFGDIPWRGGSKGIVSIWDGYESSTGTRLGFAHYPETEKGRWELGVTAQFGIGVNAAVDLYELLDFLFGFFGMDDAEDDSRTVGAKIRACAYDLKNPDPEVRFDAAVGLYNAEDRRAVPFLIEALKDESKSVRRMAAEGLGDVPTREGTVALIEALRDKERDVREEVVDALRKSRSKKAVPGLIETLADRDSIVRWKAARVLGEIGDVAALEPLVKKLGDEYSTVRYQAARALGKLGDKRAISALLWALRHRDCVGLRRGAAIALGDISDQRAVRPLITAVTDEDQLVRERAAESLEKMTGQRFGTDSDKWKAWYEKNK